jgi:hypothetical protein
MVIQEVNHVQAQINTSTWAWEASSHEHEKHYLAFAEPEIFCYDFLNWNHFRTQINTSTWEVLPGRGAGACLVTFAHPAYPDVNASVTVMVVKARALACAVRPEV